ncbi:hypothetical protein UA18_01355 [Burkholderia multivorans]|uniref:Bacteriophage protein n=1 Tax=Burkholderia multivorans TaxID=87883 RepID=A0ABD7LGQ9_9BURK|nr:hypothetical protein [Burkholderia multivorans]MDR8806081.1 hypothetical protein [Burkholderia multivorans]MDR8921271.1 hypothetical protein [Burkholderia multivorans]MDR8926907.1 hypothetical protein [Burkholderia multivorans]MDR8969499.1 hypothetical protein [Burkholderia multivorans]
MRTWVKRIVIAGYNHGYISGRTTALLFRIFKLGNA